MFEHHRSGVSGGKTRPASQALCAGWNRFSAPGMHFTLSASDGHTAASDPHREHADGTSRRVHARSNEIITDVNANKPIKFIVSFLSKLRL